MRLGLPLDAPAPQTQVHTMHTAPMAPFCCALMRAARLAMLASARHPIHGCDAVMHHPLAARVAAGAWRAACRQRTRALSTTTRMPSAWSTSRHGALPCSQWVWAWHWAMWRRKSASRSGSATVGSLQVTVMRHCAARGACPASPSWPSAAPTRIPPMWARARQTGRAG